MKTSHLTVYAEKRLESLERVDQKQYPEELLLKSQFRNDRPAKMSPYLKRAQGQKPHVLFEVKKSSPTLGSITEADAVGLCRGFIDQGAQAVSVLVDPVNFGGHPDDLKTCVETFPEIPFLWKDFVLGSYQILLAKHLGASAVLLMTQLLEDEVLKDLFQLCQSVGIEAFVETHSLSDLEFALSLNPSMVGINARDFATPGLPVHLETASTIVNELQVSWPRETVLVAQSGIAELGDLDRVLANMPTGLPDAVQIGSSVSGKEGMPSGLKAALELSI